MKFRNHYNVDYKKGYEPVDTKMPSNTVPNQSMTVTEIYRRYASGRGLSSVGQGVYDDDGTGKIELDFDDYMPDIERLDLADRQSVLEQVKDELDGVKKRLEAITAAKKKAAEKAKADLEKKLKRLEELEKPKEEETPEA